MATSTAEAQETKAPETKVPETKVPEEKSVFSTKYSEFVEDLLGTLPEYTSQIKF